MSAGVGVYIPSAVSYVYVGQSVCDDKAIVPQ